MVEPAIQSDRHSRHGKKTRYATSQGLQVDHPDSALLDRYRAEYREPYLRREESLKRCVVIEATCSLVRGRIVRCVGRKKRCCVNTDIPPDRKSGVFGGEQYQNASCRSFSMHAENGRKIKRAPPRSKVVTCRKTPGRTSQTESKTISQTCSRKYAPFNAVPCKHIIQNPDGEELQLPRAPARQKYLPTQSG